MVVGLRPWINMEKLFVSVKEAYDYLASWDSKEKIAGRKEAEEIIKKDPCYAVRYAADILGKRWPEAEPYIKTERPYNYYYASSIVHGRWKEAEEFLSSFFKLYLDVVVACGASHETRLKWIQEEGVTQNLFDILSRMDRDVEVQEILIKARPDLIGRIKDLDPRLKEKYSHEVELEILDI